MPIPRFQIPQYGPGPRPMVIPAPRGGSLDWLPQMMGQMILQRMKHNQANDILDKQLAAEKLQEDRKKAEWDRQQKITEESKQRAAEVKTWQTPEGKTVNLKKGTVPPEGSTPYSKPIEKALKAYLTPQNTVEYLPNTIAPPSGWVPYQTGIEFETTPEGTTTFRTGVLPSRQKKGDEPLKLPDLTRLKHPKTGEPPPLGTTANQAKQLGYKPISQASEKQSLKLRSAKAVVNRIGQLADKIWGLKGNKGLLDVQGGMDRLLATPQVWWQMVAQQPDIALLERSKRGFASLMMKALGEERVTDQDVQRGLNLWPEVYPVPDRREVVERKLQQLYDLFDEIANRPTETKSKTESKINLEKGKLYRDKEGNQMRFMGYDPKMQPIWRKP